jgi:hypothetical protein
MEALFQPLVQGDFDSKFQYMKHRMMAYVNDVLA